MDNLKVTASPENIFSQSERIENDDKNLPPITIADNLVPRPQNKMQAETTEDMFLSGQMCE